LVAAERLEMETNRSMLGVTTKNDEHARVHQIVGARKRHGQRILSIERLGCNECVTR
jgi:hypothetical protein